MCPHRRQRLVGFATRAIFVERKLDGVEQILVADRLGEELDRARLHGPHRHRDVAVASDEDDRDLDVRLGELGLKVEAADTGQPDVEHQATRDVGLAGLEELGRRSEHLDLHPHRRQQAPQGVTDGGVVVDDVDDRPWLRRVTHYSAPGG
jgi:hypothetical protein